MLRWPTILAASFLFASCGTPNEGGGTELPNPIKVVILPFADTSLHVAARQTRIWTVESNSGGVLALSSRGLVADSMGFLRLPPDSGTYLLESWIQRTPPESLSLRAQIPTGAFPSDGSCLQLLSRTESIQRIRSCGDTSMNPSRDGVASHPEVLSWIHVTGASLHPFRILDSMGQQSSLSALHLWSLDDSSLVFRGSIGVTNGYGLLPTLTERAKFVVVGWNGTGPSRVPARLAAPKSDSAWRSCADHLAALGDRITSLHRCYRSPLFPADSSALWVAVDFWP